MDLDLQRRRLEEMLRHLEDGASPDSENLRDSTQELSVLDNHPADVGTENYMSGLGAGLKMNAENVAEKINSALARLKRGDYDICRVCGSKIDSRRLEALPYADTCHNCGGADVPVSADPAREPRDFDWPRFRRYGTSEEKD